MTTLVSFKVTDERESNGLLFSEDRESVNLDRFQRKSIFRDFPQTKISQNGKPRKVKIGIISVVCFSVLVVIGIILRVIIVNKQSDPDSSYRSYTYDWETNSDTSILDREDYTIDISWSSWPISYSKITRKPYGYKTNNPYNRNVKTLKPYKAGTTPNPYLHNNKTASRVASNSYGRTNLKDKASYQNWTQDTSYSMDSGSTPCADFYQYSCGRWTENAQIPNHFVHVNKFQALEQHVAESVKQYLGRKTTKITPAERKMHKFYNNCNQYGRSNRLSVLANLNSLVTRLSEWTLTSTYRNANFESLLLSLNKLNSWPIFQLVPRVSTNNETVIAISVGDLPISLAHLAAVPAPDLKLSDKVVSKLQSKLALLKRAYENDVKHASASSALSILKTHSNINKLIFHKIWKVPIRSYNSRYTSYYSPYKPYRYRTEVTATKLADDILLLEVDLLLARLPGKITKHTKITEEISVAELQRRCGIVTWDRYLKALTSKDVDKVFLLVPSTIFKICDAVKTYTGSIYSSSKKKLQNFVLLQLMKKLMKYYEISTVIDDEFYSDELATEDIAVRSRSCWQWTSVAFDLVVGNIYLKETDFSVDRYRKKIEAIVTHVREEYRSMIQHSVWLDEETRANAVRKVDNLYLKLFYPPLLKDSIEFRTYTQKLPMSSSTWYDSVLQWMKFEFNKTKELFSQPTDRSVWPIGPQEVNAVHTPWFNDIIIPAGITQRPFFDDSRPMAMNFGAIGSIIGHEITHAIVGNAGTHYNQYGQMEDWVTWKSKLHLQKTSKCYLDLYKSINSKFDKLRGNRTLEEDMSDNGGIKAAFGNVTCWSKQADLAAKTSQSSHVVCSPETSLNELPISMSAYQTWKNNNREVLSSETQAWMKSEKLNMDQLFFLGYSQMHCGKRNSDGLKTISSRKHSPGLLRVNGAFVGNEFMRLAFSCHKSGGPQCQLW